MSETRKNQLLFFVYFALSTLFTWWFVVVSPLYISKQQMVLSTAVAGGKWAIQVIAGYLVLREKKWLFLKNIGWVCFVGSCILLPYVLLSLLHIADGASFFVGSLAASVLTMIYAYYRAVRNTAISLRWWFAWLGCLAVAITLQLTVVFGVIGR
jgi:hypothetical protein